MKQAQGIKPGRNLRGGIAASSPFAGTRSQPRFLHGGKADPRCAGAPGWEPRGEEVKLRCCPHSPLRPRSCSHPTWSIPHPKPAQDAVPPVAMATPILAGLPWLPGPQPQRILSAGRTRRLGSPRGYYHRGMSCGAGSRGVSWGQAEGVLVFGDTSGGRGFVTMGVLGGLVGLGSPRSIT